PRPHRHPNPPRRSPPPRVAPSGPRARTLVRAQRTKSSPTQVRALPKPLCLYKSKPVISTEASRCLFLAFAPANASARAVETSLFHHNDEQSSKCPTLGL